MSETQGCRRWCTSFLFTLGLTAVFLWLIYRPHAPRYFLVEFQVPRIVNSAGAGANSNLSFTLEVENKNKQMGILHDALNLSLSYGNQSAPVVTIPGFHQGHDKTADKTRTAGAGWVPVAAAKDEVAAKGAAVFQVRVKSRYRYKVMLWKSRHHAVSVEADVEVDGEGKKKVEKGIRLRSSGAPPLMGARWILAVAGLTAAGLSLGVEWVVDVLLLLMLFR